MSVKRVTTHIVDFVGCRIKARSEVEQAELSARSESAGKKIGTHKNLSRM